MSLHNPVMRAKKDGIYSTVTGNKMLCSYCDFAECKGPDCVSLRWAGYTPTLDDIASNPAGIVCYCNRR